MALKSDIKFEEKLTCTLKKWHEEFGKFSHAEKLQFY